MPRVPPKRKRGGGSAAVAVSEHSPADMTLISSVLSEWNAIAKDKPRSLELVTALVENQCMTPGIPDHTDAYWLLLATHTINRLVHFMSTHMNGAGGVSGKQKQHQQLGHVAVVLARLCHSVATVMMVDKSKLERLTLKQVRSLVGRAMVSLTVGSFTAMPYTTGKALWASVLALDMVVFQQSIKTTPTLDKWHVAHQALASYVEDNDAALPEADEVENLIVFSAEEKACLTVLQNEPQPTPTKRNRRSPSATLPSDSTAESDQEVSPLQATFGKIDQTALEGRVIIKRMPSMALIWLVNGQERILQFCLEVLQNGIGEIPAQTFGTPTKKKTNRKRTTSLVIPANVAKVTLVSRLLAIIAEALTNGGSRPPVGGMDSYVQTHLTEKKVSKTADVRDLMVVTMHSLVQAHADCLGDSKPLVLVNDDEATAVVTADGGGVARFCPLVHKALDSLCRAEGASTRKLLSIVACHILQSNILDAKLCSFAIGQFHNSFSFLLDGRETSSTDLVESYKSLPPLPTPTLPKKAKKSRKKEDECSFAGLLENSNALVTDQALLPLYFRALGSPAAIFSMLLDIMEACYDTTSGHALDETPDAPETGKARKQAKQKKSALAVKTEPRLRRLTAIRAGLASDACNVFRSLTTNQHSLQAYFRSCLSVDDLCRFVRLMGTLEAILTTTSSDTKNRGPAASFFHPSSTDFNLYERTLWSSHTNLCYVLGRGTLLYSSVKKDRVTPILGDSKTRLTVFQEIPKACGTKGWPLHLPASFHALVTTNLTCEPVLPGDLEPEEFIVGTLIRSISEALEDPSLVTHSKRFGNDDDDMERTTDEKAALSFRDARLLLVAISRMPSKDQLKHLSVLAKVLSKSLAAYQLDHSLRSVIVEHGEVSQFVARVVTVYAALLNIVSADLTDALVDQVGPYQYSLPPLYTLGDILNGVIAKDGNWYRKDCCFMGLLTDWESPALPAATPKMPLPKDILRETNDILEHALQLGFQCARKDYGQLLFAAWNASGRKLTWDPRGLKDASVKEFSNAKSLPSFLMELRDDICSVYLHVNSNKRASLSNSLLGQTLKNHATSERAEPLQVTLNIMLTKAIAAIHHLLDTSIIQRDFEDIELTLLEALPVYIAFVMAMHTTTIDTMLARVEGKKKVKGGRKRRKLPASKGSCYDIELLASIMSDEDSGGSDDDFDHDEANEDGGIDGLAQLHEACNLFGAAPVHPDWLDTTCSLREGIDAVVAGQNAAKAIQCLTKLGTVANAQHSKAVKKCMAVLAGKNPGDLVCDAAASLCCLAIDSSNGMLPPDTVFNGENEFQRAVAAVFQIRPVAIQDFYNDSASTGWRAAKEAWIPNCPQQIIGFIQSQSVDGVEASCGEYRAGGDWEMLLSEALTGACTGCGMDDSDNNIWKSFDVTSGESVGQVERVFDAYVLEERWLRIAQGVVSQLMPAAALLRFRQTAANGRNPHPLRNNEGTQVLDPLLLTSNDKEMAEFACPRYTFTEPLRFALLECLSFLARRSARSNGDDLAKRSCFAAASNLLVDAQPCEDIEGIETISMVFDTIEAMQSILVAAQPIDDNYRTSIRHLMSLLIKVLQTRGKSPAMSKIIGRESDVLRIFACISSGTIFVASVLGIARFEKEHLVDDERALRERAIKGLVFVLCADDTFVEDESRAAVAAILGEILELEVAIDSTSNDPLAVRNTLQRILSSLEGCRLQKFVELAYPERKETADCSLHASRTAIGVAKVLALVLCGDTPGSSLKFCHAVFGILQKRLESVATPLASREHSLGVLFLYGCRLGSLDAIGASLIERLSVNILHEPELIQMECLLSFVQGLRAARRDNAKSLALPTTQVKSKASKEGERVERCPVPGGKVTRACSHFMRNGFFHQHWYNCYTCGLVFDKGCCTLCALVCHRGHEVAYSRSSSFFCDCGADVASAGEQNRVICKCLSLLSEEEAENLWQEERAKNYLTAKFEKAFSDKAVVKACAGESGRPMDLFVNVALLFHEEALIAIKKVKAAASRDSWVLTIFGLINDQSQGESTTWVLGEGEGASSPTITQESIISVLIGRSGTPLKLDSFDDPKLVPIRAVRAGSFNVKLSLDSTTDRVKRTMLARHGIVRSAVVADSRGRLIIAEPSSLVFCSILPAINTRYVDDPLTTQIGRSQMSVVASHPLSFDIVGMRTCTENERHVVVWGTSEACVVVLTRHGIGVERTVHLDLDLEPHECDSDYVLRCDWVPASQALVSVACGTFVKVYSVANAENDEIIIPQLSYNVAYEAVIKDTAWVSLPFRSQGRKGEPKKRKLTLFLLMDTGRLHEIQLQFDNQGNIDGQGSSFLEGSSRCVDIPTVGVRPYEGVTAGKPGSSTRSMGEGCSLCFLPLSNMLLYKCISSCVVALPFDKTGDIAGSFELLPNRLDSEVLGNGPDAYSIVGPYTHWTEIGVLDGGIRLVCVGKSSRTNHPKLLSVVVKEASVKVKEIAWTAGGSVGLGLSLSSSFEGLALFSGPSLSACSKFDERLYFCVVTSNGSILIYGEDSNDSIHTGERPGSPVDSSAEGLEKKGSATPHIALTFYEDLRNVSEADELKFAGDGIGSGNSDSIKEKLSSKNSVYLMSPSRDGCTVTVTLEGPVEVSKLGDREIADLPMDIPNLDDMGKHTVDLAIVALRFLVGSTNTDCVPSRLFVHGRPFQLTPNVKRWYDVPLTMEEVLMAVRSGSVSVGLGPTFESGNSPMVDAIEVYAVERNRIRHLVPQTLECSRENVYDRSPSKMSTEQSDCASTLVLNTRILSFLYQLVGARVNHDTLEGKSLKHLIRSTALNDDRSVLDSVRELLEQVEANPDLRQKFLDEGTLLGISAALQGVSNNVRQAEVNELEEKHLGKKLKTLLDASVQSAISIALTRPQNYVSATETFSSDGLSPTSIAIDASDILLYAINAGIAYQDVFERIVHLVLAELCIGNSYKESSKSSFATFAIISKMLKLERQDVVERCCNAVRSFVDNYSPSVNRQVADLFKSADPDLSAPIAYQCDSCSKFPITDSRYTLLEDDHDIDLCTKCYQLARTYAEGIDASPNAPVIINGRSIGGSIKLSCGQLKMMESVPIANGTAIVEQVEQALQEAKSAGPRSSDVDNRLRRAIQRSQPAIATSPDKIVINFDTFTDCLFDNIVGLVSYMLDGSNAGIPSGRLNPLLTLVLDSINFGANENAHIARGKRYSREVLTYIRRMLGAVRSGPRSEKTRYVLLINFLRSLGRLTGVNNDDITGTVYEPGETGGQSPDKVKRKTDPRFVCDVHSVPAVRRRCSTGGNKNKRFYVCGMDRKQRCKYFKWADESKTRDRVGQQSRLEKELELFIWQLLSDSSHSQTTSLSDKLCDLMEAEFSRSDCGKGQDISPSEVKSDGDQIPLNNKSRSSSLYDREAAMKDLEDGVFCSKEKKFWVAPLWMCSHDTLALPRELFLSDDESDDQNLADKFIEASLDLVSTVASASSHGDLQMPSNKRWCSLLCEVISANPASRFRPQAKKALKRMCGGNRALYHSVGDHYVFGFQLKEILHHAKATLDGALSVREMARQCGEKWNEEEVSWQRLDAGELLGTIDLIPEDCMTAVNSKRIGAILDELLSVSKSRVDNWRNFCSLLALPVSYHQRPGLSVFGQERLLVERTFSGPPILSLFWLCCTLPGPNQVLVMKLIDLALTSAQDRKSLSTVHSKGSAQCEVFGENIEGVVSDAMEVDTDEVSLPFTSAPQANPEETLLKGTKALSVEDIYAFSIQFVLGGRTADLRRIACQIATKLCLHLEAQSLFQVFRFLIGKPLAEIESMGCSSVQFLQLLQSTMKVGNWKGSHDLAQAARKIAVMFTKQMNLFRWMGGRAQVPLEPGRTILTKRFDLSTCVHCHRLHHPSQKSGNVKAGPQTNEKKSSKDTPRTMSNEKGSTDASQPSEQRWLPDQVRPFVRGRLENSTENTCSSEFAVLVQLKCRLAISEIYATVNEPRGRYAKTIVVSFTPRQVAEVNELKSIDYEHLWQECATLTLTRGATHASCTLPIAVTAANLKFEYRDFYDRVGGSRAADGSFVLFCPRCSRPVNNAHGVCGSCGECLFQCRRCRHIQYDRPDAFLCTECGHCSSGSFSYELNAGIASNAVAIVDDESYARMVKVSRVATKLHCDLQTALVEMVRTGSRKRAPPEVHPLSEYSPAMKRALMGDLPEVDDDIKKGGPSSSERRNNDTSGRMSEGRSSSNAANRARSLLRLARQLRSEGEHSGRSRELLVREAFLGGSEFSLEEVDDDGTDIVGLFGGGDRSDTLTRLIASITGRSNAGRIIERATTNTSTVAAANSNTTALTKKDSSKNSAQECEKLYQLMREAERECHELERRLDAWNRLERDCLKGTILESEVLYSPTKCSRCAGPVTLHLLLLMVRLVRSEKIKHIESVITKDFVRALFVEPPSMVKELFELKRLAITTLCLKSEYAAKLILEELRARLRASSDEVSASILGKLLEHDFSLSAEFLALADETLNSDFMIC